MKFSNRIHQFMKTKYRVVCDGSGFFPFSVQRKYWFLPFWFDVSVFSFPTKELAMESIEKFKNPVVHEE